MATRQSRFHRRMRHLSFDLLVRRAAATESHRRKLRADLVKWWWRAFWAVNIPLFFYGYWLGLRLIHCHFGGVMCGN